MTTSKMLQIPKKSLVEDKITKIQKLPVDLLHDQVLEKGAFKKQETINTWKTHRAYLASIGIDNIEDTGTLKISGKFTISNGIFYPNLLQDKNKSLSRKYKNISITKERRLFESAKVYNSKTRKFRKIPNNSTVQVLPFITPSTQNSAQNRSSLQLDVSYLVSNTLNLSGQTTIIIDRNVRRLVIIAKYIVTNSNQINFVWNTPYPPAQPDAPDSPNKASINNLGRLGNKGKNGTIGHNAPDVEIWTTDVIRNSLGIQIVNPLRFELVGQDGGRGGDGSRGGEGGDGKAGADCKSQLLNCKAGPTSGTNGMPGAQGGEGGIGGGAGRGGSVRIYAPSSISSYFQTTVLNNRNGLRGAGGAGGPGGAGGKGGKRGAITGYCANKWFDWSDRIDGKDGGVGDLGSRGRNGSPAFNSGLLTILSISLSNFNQRIIDPALYSANTYEGYAGDAIQLYGINIKNGDNLLTDRNSLPIPAQIINTSPSLQIVTFNIPYTILGGWLDLNIYNPTSNRFSNHLMLYIKAKVTSIVPNRVQSGDQVTLHGTGFGGTSRVHINGIPVSRFSYPTPQSIQFTAIKPNTAQRVRGGFLTKITVVDYMNRISNEIDLIFSS